MSRKVEVTVKVDHYPAATLVVNAGDYLVINRTDAALAGSWVENTILDTQ